MAQINIVQKKHVFAANNMSAELWALKSARPENFNKEFSPSEIRLLSQYVTKVYKGHAVTSSLLQKIEKHLKSIVTWIDCDVDVNIVKLSKSETIQKNILLTELLPYAKAAREIDIVKLKEKLQFLESL